MDCTGTMSGWRRDAVGLKRLQTQITNFREGQRLVDIQPDLILAFLNHLEHDRHKAVRSRNLRLTALRAFLKFAGRRDLYSLHAVERALAVPMKRFERPMLNYLTRGG